MKLGLIGATGWLGAALGTRLLEAAAWPAAGMVLLNRSGRRAAYEDWPGVTWAGDAGALCAACDVIVIAVRPEDFPVQGFDGGGRLVVSFMVGWPLDRLQALCPGGRVVRAMPNGAASVGRSFTPWVAGPGLGAEDAAVVRRLLAVLGDEAQVADEGQLDYLSGLSGSGAAYPALMAEAMLDDAQAAGLPRDLALRAVESVVAGSALLLAGRMDSVSDLLATYHGYRGVTDAGLNAARAAGFSQAIRSALAAAAAKAGGMSRDG
jgi:pyrroline-5-carboxylate reductase